MSLEQHILITTSNFAFSEVHLFRTDITPPNFSRWYIRSPCWSKWSGCSFCSSCLTCWQFGHALLAPTWSNLPFLLYCLVFPSLFFGARFSCYAQSWTHALCVKKKIGKRHSNRTSFNEYVSLVISTTAHEQLLSTAWMNCLTQRLCASVVQPPTQIIYLWTIGLC